jgi:hypothetical protein
VLGNGIGDETGLYGALQEYFLGFFYDFHVCSMLND